MTVQVIQMFAPTVLTTSAATLYTSGGIANSVTGVGRVRFTNTTAGPVTVTAYAVPSGGTAGVGNCFFDQQIVPALGILETDVPVLVFGQFLQALASANTSITIQALSGAVFT